MNASPATAIGVPSSVSPSHSKRSAFQRTTCLRRLFRLFPRMLRHAAAAATEPQAMRFARPHRALSPMRWPLLTVAGALLVLALTSAGSSGAVSSVTYHAGWNLVGAPDGTRYAGADGPIYTLQPGDTAYEAFPAGTPAVAGAGYWVYFGAGRRLDLPDGQGFVTIELPPGQWVLIGNPSGLRTAPVSGADAVFTYDPGRGYRAV